jgi:hypothetical protein
MLRPAQILGDDLAIVHGVTTRQSSILPRDQVCLCFSGRSVLRPYKSSRGPDFNTTLLLRGARCCRSAEPIESPRKICGNGRRVAPFDVRPLQHEGDFAVAHQSN